MHNIIKAVKNNNLQLVKEYLSIDSKVANIWEGDSSLLALAVEKNYIDVAELLLKNGAKIDYYYNPPLKIAVRNQNLPMIKLLVKHGADINKADILDVLTMSGNVDIFNFLFSIGFDVAKGGYVALERAIEKQDIAFVDVLLKAGVQSEGNNRDKSPLILAIQNKNLQLVELLANEKNSSEYYLGMPAIIWAAKDNSKDIVSVLLKNGADINANDRHSCAALMWACQRGHKETVILLISKGADYINYLTNKIVDGNLDIVKFMIDAGVDVNSIGVKGYSILAYAAYAGHKNIVEYLVTKGAEVNLRSVGDRTALHLASIAGHSDIVEYLINKGAMVDLRDVNGDSALMFSFLEGKEKVMSCLINKGANFYDDLLDCDRNNKPDLEDFLQSLIFVGVDFNQLNINGETILMVAAENGDEDLVRLLIQENVMLDMQSIDGNTALILAALEGRQNIVDILINAGANIDIQNDDGCTALIVALHENKFNSAKSLIKAGASIFTQDINGHNALDNIGASNQPFDKETKLDDILMLLNQSMEQINRASNFLFSHIANNAEIKIKNHSSLEEFHRVNKKDLAINYTKIYCLANSFVPAENVIKKACRTIEGDYLSIKGVCKNNVLVSKLNPDVASHIASFLVPKQISEASASFLVAKQILEDQLFASQKMASFVETMNEHFNGAEEYKISLLEEDYVLKKQKLMNDFELENVEQNLIGEDNNLSVNSIIDFN